MCRQFECFFGCVTLRNCHFDGTLQAFVFAATAKLRAGDVSGEMRPVAWRGKLKLRVKEIQLRGHLQEEVDVQKSENRVWSPAGKQRRQLADVLGKATEEAESRLRETLRPAPTTDVGRRLTLAAGRLARSRPGTQVAADVG